MERDTTFMDWKIHYCSLFFFSLIFGCAGSWLQGASFLFSRCGEQASHWGGFSCGARALGCMGFSTCCVWAPRLWSAGSVVVAHGLCCSVAVGSSRIRDQTCVSCIGRRILYHWVTREAPFCLFLFLHFFLLFHYSMMGFSYFLKGPSEYLLIVTSDTQTDIRCCVL